MNQSLVTFGRAIVLLLLAWKIEAWLVPLLALTGIEDAQLKSIVAIAQWGLYISAACLLLVNWWRLRSSEAKEQAESIEVLEGYEGMPDPPLFPSIESQEDQHVDQDQMLIVEREEKQALYDQQFELDDHATQVMNTIHDLPAPLEDFTGRQTEIKELLKRFGADKSHMLCLQSAEAGVGKSALILKLASHLTPHYPDAQLFIDMRGTSQQPLSAADVMRYVVGKLAIPDAALPNDKLSLPAAYQSVLEGKQILLVLDDVANKEQIEPLTLPKNSALLMTSRLVFTLPDLYVKRISPFSPHEAQAFLLRLTPRIGDHAGELATLCGLLPLALRLSAGILANREDIRPEEYIWQLRDPQSPISRLSGVEKILQLSYNWLDEAEQNLWHQLAIFPGEFNDLAASAISQQDLNSVQKSLHTLTRLCLLEAFPPLTENNAITTAKSEEETGENDLLPQKEPSESQNKPIQEARRYHLHKQARLLANPRLTDEERVAGIRRHAKHFEEVLRKANKQEMINEGVGQALFDEEWLNIQAGQSWAMQQVMTLQNGKEQEQKQEDHLAIALCSTYPEAGGVLLEQNLPPQEHIRWLEAALMASRHLEQPIGENTYLGQLGQAYTKLGKYKRALDLFEKQLKMTQELGNRNGESNILGHIGQTHKALGQTRQAISFHEQQLMVLRDLNDESRVIQVLGELGDAYSQLGQINDAITCYQKQLASSRKARDMANEAQVLGSLGNLYSEVGHIHNALNYYERQLELAYSLNDQVIQRAAFGKLGNLYADSGDLSHAITCYKEQLLLARHLRDRKEEGSALGNLGITYAELGEMGQATRYCEQALQIDRELGDKENEAIGAWNLGLIYEHLGKFDRAIQLLQITVQYERAIGDANAEVHAEHLEAVRQKMAY